MLIREIARSPLLTCLCCSSWIRYGLIIERLDRGQRTYDGRDGGAIALSAGLACVLYNNAQTFFFIYYYFLQPTKSGRVRMNMFGLSFFKGLIS